MSTALVHSGELKTTEGKVLRTLRESDHEMPPFELVECVLGHSDQLTDIDVKRAIWSLISRGKIRLSPDQLLSVPQKTGQEVA